MDLAAIQAAMTGLNAAANIGSSLLKLASGSEIQAKVTELNAQILAAQTSAITANSDQFTLLQQVRSLEEELTRVKAWDREKERYELKELQPRNFAYAIKEGAQSGEPAHLICATCYESGKKRILQSDSHVNLICPDCKTKVQDRPIPPYPSMARTRTDRI